jgi:hypothetical protein
MGSSAVVGNAYRVVLAGYECEAGVADRNETTPNTATPGETRSVARRSP